MVEPENDDDYFLAPEEAKRNRELQKKRQQERNRLIDDIKWVLSKPQGRRCVLWILSICRVWWGTYVPGGVEAQRASDFNEGRRDIGLALIELLNEANPAIVLQMQSEKLGEIMKEKNKEQDNA